MTRIRYYIPPVHKKLAKVTIRIFRMACETRWQVATVTKDKVPDLHVMDLCT